MKRCFLTLTNNGNFGVIPVVATRSIASDGITGIGDATIKVDQATWGTWMSNGQRDLSTSTIEHELSKSIVLFPNPTKDFVSLNLNKIDCQKCRLDIYDLNGRAVISSIYNDGEKVDLQSLNSGFYTLTLSYGNIVYSKKFVKN